MKDLAYSKAILEAQKEDDIYYALTLYQQWIDEKDKEIASLKNELKFYKDWSDENDARLEYLSDRD